MEEGYVNINDIPTRVIAIGGWIDKPTKNRDFVIVIPGKVKTNKQVPYYWKMESI